MSIAGGTVSAVEVLLRMLDNPAEYQAKLAQFKQAADNADAMIALAGPASEIVSLRDKLKAEAEGIETRQKSHEAQCAFGLEQAKREATKLVESAKTQAAAMVAEASDKLGEARKTLEKAAATRAEADHALATAQSAQSAADDLARQAKNQLADCEEARRVIGAEKDRLRKLADTLQAAL